MVELDVASWEDFKSKISHQLESTIFNTKNTTSNDVASPESSTRTPNTSILLSIDAKAPENTPITCDPFLSQVMSPKMFMTNFHREIKSLGQDFRDQVQQNFNWMNCWSDLLHFFSHLLIPTILSVSSFTIHLTQVQSFFPSLIYSFYQRSASHTTNSSIAMPACGKKCMHTMNGNCYC